MGFQAAIFDLDGVIVNTVPIHFKAWKKMFAEYGHSFSFEDYKEKVDGIPRKDGARAILKKLSEKDIEIAGGKKQGYFLEFLNKRKVPIYSDTIKLIKNIKKNGGRVAVISSSKNSPNILKRIGLMPFLDTEINGADITKGKPDPQIFIMASNKLKAKPGSCIVFEDAILGVEAAKRASMVCVGIDRYNDPDRLRMADVVVPNLKNWDYKRLEEMLEND